MMEFKIDKVSETLSTNELLKKIADKEPVPEGYTIIAVSQTNGHGQIGAFWESQPGQNLTFSLLLRPDFLKADQMFLLSKTISLAIIDYLNSFGIEFKIKWPNDIYHDDKKICGILIENQLMGSNITYSVIGIGLNINQEAFISDAPNPISLFNILGEKLDLTKELPRLLDQIAVWYRILAEGWTEKINDAYFANLYRTGKPYKFRTPDGNEFYGKIESVEPTGGIHIVDELGNDRKFLFKEVEFMH